jgi:hypothetical protein
MTTILMPKNADIFICEKCNFKCSKISNYNTHLLTRKHNILQNTINENAKNAEYICHCNKVYKHHSSLWNHKKKCNFIKEKVEGKTNEPDLTDKKLILALIQQNNELQKQMMKVIENGTHNITNNSHNKTKFNLNLFLNETCKDAMNLTDFVSTIKLQLTDLENVGKNGYVNGISNIIINSLNALEVTKRPVHCSDLKREIMYVKDENKWEKEKEKISKAINKVSYKNVLQIPAWQKEHPGCEYSHSKENDTYLHIVHESMGALTEEQQKGNINKIITKIAKEIVIEKES